MNPQLIVALDVPAARDIPPILDALPPEISFYKVGLELFCAEGPDALRPLQQRGKQIFLDLKLHDIPRTVERAVRAAADRGIDLLTLHAAGGRAMIEAAAAAAGDRVALIAVTTLTSLGPSDLADIGITRTLPEQALALGQMAMDCGARGVVTSVWEAASLRARLGPGALVVTPGIRLPNDQRGDQKRVAVPSDAVRAGADYLVVGRPILDAPDPATAALAILADMRSGSSPAP